MSLECRREMRCQTCSSLGQGHSTADRKAEVLKELDDGTTRYATETRSSTFGFCGLCTRRIRARMTTLVEGSQYCTFVSLRLPSTSGRRDGLGDKFYRRKPYHIELALLNFTHNIIRVYVK
ncbi:hypothetical protein M404DRAFT_512850 [Pisolithus tinctorius Marx 270]|uniref:Uncharacterized protein n=1 Tax=Pisolithus tinctorius Marx 270 TaxID=870435 RepID=A0A0C3PC74_PISTI|nr:hypothetical protein M404DRAFT_512850 [Pisolithus tinctorius Marx 270]